MRGQRGAGWGSRVTASYGERFYVIFISAVVGLSLAGMLGNAALRPWPRPVLSAVAPEFDGSRALARTAQFVTTCPTRAAGDPGKGEAAQWIVDQLVAMGYDPQLETFGAWVGGVHYPDLANVWAVRRGTSPEAVVVWGHYDLPPFVRQGAADDGSAVGAMLELAACFADETPNRTVLFLFLDGSEYGMAGSESFLSWQPYPDGRIVAAVGLDFLNIGEMAGLSLEFTGTRKGYTPPWLRSTAVAAASAAGKVFTVDPVAEWAERSVAVAPTDVGIFVSRRVPAVNLAGVPVDPARERSVYHTAADTIENLDAVAFGTWGRTAETIARSLSERPDFPRGSDGSSVYWGLGESGYLAGWGVRAIQFVLFAPLWGVVVWGWSRRRRTWRASLNIVLAEARRLGVVAGGFLLGLVSLKLMTLVGLLRRYHVYPASPKDPFLEHPAVLPLVVALAVAVGVIHAAARFTRWLDPPLGSDWAERFHALTTFLAALVFLVWLEGAGFAAVTFLVLPAYLWILLAEPVGRAAWVLKGAGGLIVAAGTVTFFALPVVLGAAFVAGSGWWFMVLGATYGLFSFKSALVVFIAAALHWEAFVLATGLGAGPAVSRPTSIGLEV